jgi:hypothetical protein
VVPQHHHPFAGGCQVGGTGQPTMPSTGDDHVPGTGYEFAKRNRQSNFTENGGVSRRLGLHASR